jgi:hypothetical protein
MAAVRLGNANPNEYVFELKKMLERSRLDSAEELHAFSRYIMSSPALLKGLGVTLAREFLFSDTRFRPTHIVGLEKWTANPVGFIVGEWLSRAREGPKIGLLAAERRKPESACIGIEFKPARYAEPIRAYFPMSAFSEKQNSLLFIDDIIDSGSTMLALYELAEEARWQGVSVQVVGFGALVARSAGLERILSLVDKKIPVAALAIIEKGGSA